MTWRTILRHARTAAGHVRTGARYANVALRNPYVGSAAFYVGINLLGKIAEKTGYEGTATSLEISSPLIAGGYLYNSVPKSLNNATKKALLLGITAFAGYNMMGAIMDSGCHSTAIVGVQDSLEKLAQGISNHGFEGTTPRGMGLASGVLFGALGIYFNRKKATI
jgi:hypothetical protein